MAYRKQWEPAQRGHGGRKEGEGTREGAERERVLAGARARLFVIYKLNIWNVSKFIFLPRIIYRFIPETDFNFISNIRGSIGNNVRGK